MSEHLLLAPLLESYFRRRLTKQRNATPATFASYRDALRMLILFAAARLWKKPAALALDDLDRDLVLAFLDELEEKRNKVSRCLLTHLRELEIGAHPRKQLVGVERLRQIVISAGA
jgi:hypothetical protein